MGRMRYILHLDDMVQGIRQLVCLVARLAPTKLGRWKMLGINEKIRASKYEIPINPCLLISLITFWSLVTNTFSFPERYMTLTVADVFALTCLRPMGAFGP
jgi:hypothetical protein